MCKGLATLPASCLKSAKDIKHKISFLLQKPELQASDQKQIKEKTTAAAPVIAKRQPDVAEVKKWKESFSHVLHSNIGQSVFTNFLKSEFSDENIEFWLACEDYKTIAASKLVTRAKQIYQQYVDPDAPREVNLDAVTREETKQNLENACPSCFDGAQRMIYILMEKDSYRRFLKSKPIQDLLQSQEVEDEPQQKRTPGCKGERQVLTGGALAGGA